LELELVTALVSVLRSLSVSVKLYSKEDLTVSARA
jgi:hypothetical protein